MSTKINKPNSPALTASAYGKLRAFFMAPPYSWSNSKFTSVFGSHATGTRLDNATLIKKAFGEM